jgi:regulatory protein
VSRGAQDGESALASILRSTEIRPQTEAELAAMLRGRRVPEQEAAAALERAKELGAVDDAAFARAWVEDRGRRRGYGRPRLREELRRRGVPDPLIDDALRTLEPRDDEAVATDLARRQAQRLPVTLPPETVARRLQGWLVRRGYPLGLAQRVALSVSGLDRDWD